MRIKHKADQIRSSLWGAIVGDAIGVPHEFKTRKAMQATPCRAMTGGGTHRQPAGTWSDDSSMILATAHSIACCGRVCYADIMRRFVWWWKLDKYTSTGTVFDIGGTTRRILERATQYTTHDYSKWGEKDVNSCGNGSLMRILPVALFLAEYPSDVRAMIVGKVSSMTHRHPRCVLACQLYAEMVAICINSRQNADCAFAAAKIHMEQRIAKAGEQKAFARLYSRDFLERSTDSVEGRGYVIDSLEIAVRAAITSPRYDSAVLSAVNLGGDTDTNASLAGGLYAAQYHLSPQVDIPKPWQNRIQNKDEAYLIIDSFVDTIIPDHDF